MPREHTPILGRGRLDSERDLGTGPKRPPGELIARRLVDPIRLQPILNIVVTGDGHKFLIAAPDGPGDRGAADLRDGPIDDARELVDHRQFGPLCQGPRDSHAKLLAVREDVKWPDP